MSYKYSHICQYVAETPWAIAPSKMAELLSVLAFRAAGGIWTAEEIQARIGSASTPAQPRQGDSVAVIPVHGVIAHRMGAFDDSSGGTSTERIGKMVAAAHADSSIGTILLDINSPGGTVPGVQELASEMFVARGRGTKKVIAHVNACACSAAYWIASQADEIVSTPSGTTGSIGVFAVHQDLSKALEITGNNVTLISAGKYKLEANIFQPLSDEAKAVIQARVDEAYSQFVKDGARGRGVSVADVKGGYGEGRALTAKDAKAAGLIDRIETFDATLSRLVGRRSQAGLRAEMDDDSALAALLTVQEDDRRRRLERF